MNCIEKKSQSQCFSRKCLCEAWQCALIVLHKVLDNSNFFQVSSRKCKNEKSNSNKNLQKQCIILDRSSLQFLKRGHQPRCSLCCNSARPLKFKNTFVDAFPRNSSSLENFHPDLLVPNQIKSPTGSEKQVNFFPISFCAKKQRSSRHKNICANSSLKDRKQRQEISPNRNHMPSHSIVCSWRNCNTVPPKVTHLSNQCIIQQIASPNTANCENAQRKNQCQTLSRNCDIFLFCSIWSIKNFFLN